MFSQENLQKISEQYLILFEYDHQIKSHKLKILQFQLNRSAKKIQAFFRKYIKKRKYQCAMKIQNCYKKYKMFKQQEKKIIEKFKRVFYSGKIANFIYKKHFKHKSAVQDPNSSTNHSNFPTIKLFSNILSTFPQFIALTSTFSSQTHYLSKLRQYQKSKFSQQWQKYQQQLKLSLQKQIKKKWIQKDQQYWITKCHKTINKEEYIEKHLKKIFEEAYEKYKKKDEEIENAVKKLEWQRKNVEKQYFIKVMKGNN